MTQNNSVIIVGGGIMGACTAYWLARQGRHVTLFDQYDIPNQQGASGDHLRVFRLTYGKDAFYTDMAAKAMPLWLELNTESGEQLLVQNGMLELATETKGYEHQSFQVLKEMGLRIERLEKEDLKRHHPIFNSKAIKFAIYHPDGGMLWAQRSTAAILHLAQRKGVKVRPHTKIAGVLRGKEGIKGIKDSEGRLHVAQDYFFAPGAWTGELLKSYGIPLKVTRQQQLYIRPPNNRGRFRPEHFPVFASLGTGFYGFPMHIHGFLKIGDHAKGPVGKPGPGGDPEVSPQFVKKCRLFLKRHIPDLADFTEMESKICFYTNTKDDDFIMDRLPDAPNAYIAAGFSGHGFKFAPLVGKTMAQMIMGGKPELNLHRFRIGRFRLKP